MKVYPDKKNQKDINKYRKNLQQIAKASNYQPIPSIPLISDDFNFTFLANSNSDKIDNQNRLNQIKTQIRKILFKKKDKGQGKASVTMKKILQENSIMNFSPIGKANSRYVPSNLSNNIENQKLSIIKLPQINIKNNTPSKRFSQNIYSPKRLKQKTQLKQNKSFTMDTGIDTDDLSILDGSRSQLKIQTKSLSKKSIDYQMIEQNKNKKSRMSEQRYNKTNGQVKRNNQREIMSSDFSRVLASIRAKNYQEQYKMEEQISSQSEEEQQYQKNSIPGPGSYNVSQSQFSSTKSKNRTVPNKSFNFGSKVQRFQKDLLSIDQNPQLKQQFQKMQNRRSERIKNFKKIQKKYIPFNSSIQRLQNHNEKSTAAIPSPVHYNPRYGIQQDLIKKIQRNFKGNFGSEQKRFKTAYKRGYDLGPGTYNIPQKSSQEIQGPSYYFVSKKQRFI